MEIRVGMKIRIKNYDGETNHKLNGVVAKVIAFKADHKYPVKVVFKKEDGYLRKDSLSVEECAYITMENV